MSHVSGNVVCLCRLFSSMSHVKFKTTIFGRISSIRHIPIYFNSSCLSKTAMSHLTTFLPPMSHVIKPYVACQILSLYSTATQKKLRWALALA